MFVRIMPVWMAVNVIAMLMNMFVSILFVRYDVIDASSEGSQVQPAEQNQHQRHAKLESHSESLRNDEAKQNDRPTDNQQSNAVADSQKTPVSAALAMLR